MKIVIIGDVHIGSSEHLGFLDPQHNMNSRLVDYSNTLNKIIDYVRMNDIEAVVFCGDYYKTRRPSSLHRKIFDGKIKELSDCGVLVFMITGNHDIIAENETTVLDSLKLAAYPNVKIYTDFDYVALGGAHDGGVNVIFAPFTNKHYFNVEKNEDALIAFREKIKSITDCLDTSLPTIMVGHYMVDGVMLGSMKITAETASNELVLPVDMFSDIDLTVMGHVHNKQIVSEDPHIVYLGSIERNTLSEIAGPKGILELDSRNMSAKFINIPVRNIYDIELQGEHYIEQLDNFDFKDAIVKIDIYCNQEDIYKIDVDKIYAFLKKKGVYHCVSINTIPKKRDVKIVDTEDLNDQELFVEYMKQNFENHDELIKLGLEIMENA